MIRPVHHIADVVQEAGNPGQFHSALVIAQGGEDLGGSWGNTDKTVKNVTFSAGTLDKEFDKNTHEYTLTIPADVSSVVVTPTASNKNYQVRTSVGGTEYARTAEVPVADGAVITVKCGDPSWPSMNANDGEARSSRRARTVRPRSAATPRRRPRWRSV